MHRSHRSCGSGGQRQKSTLILASHDVSAQQSPLRVTASRCLRADSVPKRKERVAPPPAPTGWDLRYATSNATKGWEDVCSAAANNAPTAWERITADPRQRDDRQHPLKGSLGSRTINGEKLDQWQYEVTAGGRIWYCIDDARRTVWMTDAHVGHPKATE